MTAKHWLEVRMKRLPAPLRQEWRALLLFGAILLIATWLCLEVIGEVFLDDVIFAPDQAVYSALQRVRSHWLDQIMTAITELGDATVVIAVTTTVGVWLLRERAWHTLIYWLMATGGGSLINSAIKIGLHRARPGDMQYDGISVFSFPSGHSTTNAVLYGFLIIIMSRNLPFIARIPVVTTRVLLVGLIAFSRLYLGAHWLSDVAGGLFFGTAWLALLGFFYMWRPGEPVEPLKLLTITAVTLVIAGSLNILFHHSADMARYAVQRAIP
ncbi:MAG: phosphatase PAP2 family protein [Asticcacaulis sp.]|uniref:phosphatase PAP2 family protein n=1 Tax=Asticcacaulis sp. TaxID=1872648 RepID=UPI0039E678B8